MWSSRDYPEIFRKFAGKHPSLFMIFADYKAQIDEKATAPKFISL